MGSQKVSRIVVSTDSLTSLAQAIDQARDLAGRMEAFTPAAMEKARSTVERNVIAPALRELRTYPPRQLGMRMRWKSERQRRYVMAMLRATKNLPYQRTGRLAAGWHGEARIDRRVKGLRVRIWNDAEAPEWRTGVMRPYAVFVQGGVGIGESRWSIARHTAPIQPFHKDRGWQPAAPIIQAAFRRANKTALRSARGSFGSELQKALKG